jgi:hypothetical protein
MGLRAQCFLDRAEDWQTLQRRDRAWFLQQTERDRWRLGERWLEEFGTSPRPGILHGPAVVALLGWVLGVALMSGLLEFQPQQRINLFWWLLLVVYVPAFWWLLGLWLGRPGSEGYWSRGLRNRLPGGWRKSLDIPLLRLAARALAQRFALAFAIGMTVSFLLYLVLTDLAFGWSSTLEVTSQAVHQATRLISYPWHALWPEAVPSATLIEQTRFFRVEGDHAVIGEIQGGWWPFLLMNLLVYVLLPRVLSFAWAEWSLGKALQRLFRQDAHIAGWWQRLSFEDVRQEAQAAPFNPSAGLRAPAARAASSPPGRQDEVWPDLDAIVAAGVWSPEQLQPYLDQLPPRLRALPQLATAQLAESAEPASYLLICKGWEPPTEMLADLCDATQAKGQQLFLWPVTLPGLKAQRAEQLLESWRLFVPRLPPNCHLLEPRTDA